MAVVDIDHFKVINDTHGHAAGDSVLVDVAQRMTSDLRPVDQLARVGGEEFLLLLPDTGLPGAARVAERLRARIRAEPMKVGAREVVVSISVGVAGVSTADQVVEDTVRRADAAMYEAKHAGRNCVRLAPDDTVLAPQPVAT